VYIVLQPGITVTGKVTEERGASIAGALIRISFDNAIRQAVSGADGLGRGKEETSGWN
jgi:hypothetical protein